MILETVLFSALPRSRTAGFLDFSVFIAPQLHGVEGDAATIPLSRYPDFADGMWAERVRAMQWTLTLRWSEDDSDEDILPCTRQSADPDRSLSRLLLPNTMPVVPFSFVNVAKANFLSFPLARLSEALDTWQRRIFQDYPEERPLRTDLVTTYGKDQPRPPGSKPLDQYNIDPTRQAELSSTIDRALEANGVTVAPASNAANATALSVEMFNRFVAMQATQAEMEGAPEWPGLDFHQALSLFGAHPNLLRKLGLVVDLRADLRGWTKRYGTPRAFAGTDWPGGYSPDATGVDITTAFPRVRTRLSSTVFRPKPSGTWLTEAGFVDLRATTAVTSEAETETLATQSLATGIARAESETLTSFGTPQRTGTPARHSGGVAIVRTDYAKQLKDDLKRYDPLETSLTNGDDLLVDAEDILMGYRVDVRRAGSAQWRSLHLRRGILTPYSGRTAQSTVDLGADEGWVEPGGTSEVSGDLAEIRIAETLARWTGWSLSLSEPGDMLDQDDKPVPPVGGQDAGALIDTLHSTIDYQQPAGGAQLLPLRFSKTPYEFRMRWVDLAGQSLPPDAADGVVLSVPYLRHDPVTSPAIHGGGAPVYGESVDVVVLRTGASAAVARSRATRYVAPPQAAASMAIAHGMFDDAQGRPKADAYDTIANRETAYLAETLNANPGAVPYLPDPLGKGILVRGLPVANGAYDQERSIAYGGTWPDLNVLSLEFDTGNAAGGVVSGRTLRVGIPLGRVAHLRLSNSLDGNGLEVLDLWRRGQAVGNRARALAGALWMLTPDRVLVVVHASQQPVTAPAFVVAVPAGQKWRGSRQVGATAATIAGKISVDAPSTQSVTFTARSTFAVDAGPGTAPPRVEVDVDMGALGTVEVADPPIGSGQGVGDVNAVLRAAFNDTKRVSLSVEATAMSRFAEYFRTEAAFAASADAVSFTGNKPIVSGSVRVTYTVAKGAPVTATDDQYHVDLATGIFVRIAGVLPEKDRIPIPSTIVVSYIPEPVTQPSSGAAQANRRKVTVGVPSSARPLAPQVEWIVPTFAWNSPAGQQYSSTRTGRGLRIYLARPWYSSGLDEELAVVLLPAAGDNTVRTDYVTRWGRDALTTGADLPAGNGGMQFPRGSEYGSNNFPRASYFDSDLTANAVRLAEFNAEVDVVRYPVGRYDATGAVTGYDADRDMWFVDMVMDTGNAYRPMIQLALARYQALSTGDLKLSPVVLADIVQLEPDRTATLLMLNAGAVRNAARITLSGPTYRANDLGVGPAKVVAVLEKFIGNDFANSAESAAWERVSETELAGRVGQNGLGEWNADIPVAADRRTGQYRIALEEYERIRIDGDAVRSDFMTREQRNAATGFRLVHQDILRIPARPRPPKA